MINFTTQKQYNLYCDYLIALCGIVKDALGISSDKSKGFPNKSFKDNLGNRAVLVSDPCISHGDQYGILSGELYPPSLILHISDLLKAEGRDLPIWHSDYESLEHHTRQVCSKDFRFIHQIDALPKTAEESEHVTITDPAITEGDVVHKTDRHGHIKIGEFETKCQADDENRHLGDGSIFSG